LREIYFKKEARERKMVENEQKKKKGKVKTTVLYINNAPGVVSERRKRRKREKIYCMDQPYQAHLHGMKMINRHWSVAPDRRRI